MDFFPTFQSILRTHTCYNVCVMYVLIVYVCFGLSCHFLVWRYFAAQFSLLCSICNKSVSWKCTMVNLTCSSNISFILTWSSESIVKTLSFANYLCYNNIAQSFTPCNKMLVPFLILILIILFLYFAWCIVLSKLSFLYFVRLFWQLCYHCILFWQNNCIIIVPRVNRKFVGNWKRRKCNPYIIIM